MKKFLFVLFLLLSSLLKAQALATLQHSWAETGNGYHITVTSTSNVSNDPWTILTLTNPSDSGVDMYIGILNFTVKVGQGEIRTYVGNVSSPSGMIEKTPRCTNTGFASNVGKITAKLNNDGSSSVVQQGILAVASFIAAGPHIFPDLKDVFIISPGARVDFQIQTSQASSPFNMYMQWIEVPRVQ